MDAGIKDLNIGTASQRIKETVKSSKFKEGSKLIESDSKNDADLVSAVLEFSYCLSNGNLWNGGSFGADLPEMENLPQGTHIQCVLLPNSLGKTDVGERRAGAFTLSEKAGSPTVVATLGFEVEVLEDGSHVNINGRFSSSDTKFSPNVMTTSVASLGVILSQEFSLPR